MKILHYTLGLPPYRTGGLTKYSLDLMLEQVKQKDDVICLFPGEIKLLNDKSKIKFYRDYKNIKVYELLNPLPVPLMNGINKPIKFMKETQIDIFEVFLKEQEIEVVHLHTLMGLYEEFLVACNKLKIKVVFTTHDYFGICTKVNFLNLEGKICENRDIRKCLQCNCSANSDFKNYICQSLVYRELKDKGVINFIKKNNLIKRAQFQTQIFNDECMHSQQNRSDYIKLLDYYKKNFEKIDVFLFNSKLTQEIYSTHLNIQGFVEPITHANIIDRRIPKIFQKKLKLTYLGPHKYYKGYHLLREIMLELQKEGVHDIILNTYGDVIDEGVSNIKINGFYDYVDLYEIFSNTDLVIIPSIWKETFGFVTLEALSYGVPVLVTENVGSKDLLLDQELGKIVATNKIDLKNMILEIYDNREILQNINQNILNHSFEHTLSQHAIKIKKYYSEKMI